MNISDKYKLIFFHIPKCAGGSVKKCLGYKNNDLTNMKSGLRQSVLLGVDIAFWNKKVYPEKWKEYEKFTIVRNPWDRVVSIYHFRKKQNDLYKQFPLILGMNAMGGDKLGPDGKDWEFKRWLLSGYKLGFCLNDKLNKININFVDNTKILENKSKKHLSDDKIKEFMDKDSKTLEEAIWNHNWFIPNVILPQKTTRYSSMILDNTPKEVVTPIGRKVVNDFGMIIARERLEWWNQIDLISSPMGKLYVDNILRFEHLENDWNEMFEISGHEPPKLPQNNKSKHKHYSEYYDDETSEFVAQLFENDIKTFGYKFGE